MPRPPAAPVNLNTASTAEPDRMPGICPPKAREIIRYREAPSPGLKDHLSVLGIGPAMLEAIRELVQVR